jgi:hypothetical protein
MRRNGVTARTKTTNTEHAMNKIFTFLKKADFSGQPDRFARYDGLIMVISGVCSLATGRQNNLNLDWVFSRERREMK